MGLFTAGSLGYLLPTAMTEEGLDRVVSAYQAKSHYANEPRERLRFSLRWSPSDSPLHLEGKEHFNDVAAMMNGISSTIRGIDTDNDWDEFNVFVNQVKAAICDVLKALDHEGVFGVGQSRQRVFVTLLMGDQDDSILRIGRSLNPPSTVTQFVKEWEEWGAFWKSR